MPTSRQRSSIPLTDLPPNVLNEILARLPLRTLFVARSVCKTFNILTTSNPHFINTHSSNAPQILVFQFGTFQRPSSLLHMVDQFGGFKSFNCKNSQLKPLIQLPKMDGTVIQYHSTYSWDVSSPFLVNSCNGLLYFRQIVPDYLSLVCNPVTCEYIIVPDVDPEMRLHSQTLSLCLGFSPGANHYKVLRIYSWKDAAGTNKVAGQVFVIGSDSWRNIDDTLPHRCLFFWDFCQTQHVNGVMYWYDGGLWPGGIISFDFEREKFGEVALPPEFQDEGFVKEHETSIGVLGGCLCLSCNDFYAYRVDLWVVRKCGNRKSWRKEFVVDTLTLDRGQPVYGQFKPLQFLRNGEILMQWMENTLVYYDPRTDTVRYFRLDRGDSGHKVVVLTPSFVPLKDALKVEKVFTQLRPRVKKRSYDCEKKKHTS